MTTVAADCIQFNARCVNGVVLQLADDGMKFACLALEKDGLAVHCIAVVETWQLQSGAGPVFNQLAVRTS